MCSINWAELNLTSTDSEFEESVSLCEIISNIDSYISFYLLHIMHIPVIILIFITIFGKEDEDAKWFVFHTAVLNLILGIIWEITIFFTNFGDDSFIKIIQLFSLNLAAVSIFPLAFTRFFLLYFPQRYEKIFTKKTLIPWLLGYDLAMIGVFTIDNSFDSSIILPIFCLIILFITICCSVLIFMQIKKMMNLVGHESRFDTFNDLRKAAFICIFQTCIISLFLITTFYLHLYSNVIDPLIDEESMSMTMWDIFIILTELQYSIYQLFAIIDTLVTLLVLRSYRNALKKVYFLIIVTLKSLMAKKKRAAQNNVNLKKNNWTNGYL